MLQAKYAFVFLMTLAAIGLWAQGSASVARQVHQAPDKDGIYYTGPEVTAPILIRTVQAPYPDGFSGKELQGMTVLAMVIGADGAPAHIQVLHAHGEPFDDVAIAAVKQSKFEPGKLRDKPVPVWIDIRVVYHADRSPAIPQILITERDLPAPNESRLEDKHHKPLSYTPPFPIHTVDADFADPFVAHPYVQVAEVSVLVSEEGLPKEVRVVRGLGFGLDKKAEAAAWQYRFLPATKRGQPVAERKEVMISFATF
ncbi:MAG: TonB family protein [Terracidiphilus sp.]|jgi:TonB family protein